jgi:hypothetical protein
MNDIFGGYYLGLYISDRVDVMIRNLEVCVDNNKRFAPMCLNFCSLKTILNKLYYENNRFFILHRKV